LGLAGLEPGDRLAGDAGHLGQEYVAVINAERCVGFFDGDGTTGAAYADLDLLAGDDEGAAAADAAVDP
jgi:hypothetical protein